MWLLTAVMVTLQISELMKHLPQATLFAFSGIS
jgi:hypothetical protein